MRLSSLALLVLALHFSPASAQDKALTLTDSLVVGFWDFNTEEMPPDSIDKTQIRLAAFFTQQHTFESRLWFQDPTAPKPEDIHKGMHMTGTWFVRDTLLGMTYTSCIGFTELGKEECEIDFDDLGDTSYLTLSETELLFFGRSRVMQSVEGWRLPLWRYEGPVPDMDHPDFWEGPTHSLRRDRGPLPASLDAGSRSGAPAFDVLGRLPSGRAPVKLYRGSRPEPSRPSR